MKKEKVDEVYITIGQLKYNENFMQQMLNPRNPSLVGVGE